MDGIEMESWWMVTSLHSTYDYNMTGSDRRYLRSPSFNPNDEDGITPPLQPSQCSLQDHAQGTLEHNYKGGRKLYALFNVGAERRAGNC